MLAVHVGHNQVLSIGSQRHLVDVVEAGEGAERGIQTRADRPDAPDLEERVAGDARILQRGLDSTDRVIPDLPDESLHLTGVGVRDLQDHGGERAGSVLLKLPELTLVRSSEGSTRTAKAELPPCRPRRRGGNRAPRSGNGALAAPPREQEDVQDWLAGMHLRRWSAEQGEEPAGTHDHRPSKWPLHKH